MLELKVGTAKGNSLYQLRVLAVPWFGGEALFLKNAVVLERICKRLNEDSDSRGEPQFAENVCFTKKLNLGKQRLTLLRLIFISI